MVQLAVPVGVAPPTAPATVAVKVKLEPRTEDEVLVVTTTVGVPFETMRENGVLGPTAK
jgi:hypothetical protein